MMKQERYWEYDMGYIPPLPPKLENNIIICGYCESQNQKDDRCCIACGGSLVDEISQKVNARQLAKPRINITKPRININTENKSTFYKFVETGTLKRRLESSMIKAIKQAIR